MRCSRRTTLTAWVATVTVAVLLAVWVVIRYGELPDDPTAVRYLLSDAAALPGVLGVGIFLLEFAAGQGTFRIFGYAGRAVLALWRPDPRPAERYGEYLARQTSSSVSVVTRPALIVGLVCLAVAGMLGV